MNPSVVPSELKQHIVTLKRLYQDELMPISEIKAHMEEKHDIKEYKEEIYIQSFAATGVSRVPPGVENDIWSQHEAVLRYYYEEEDVPPPKLRQIMETYYNFPKPKEPFEYIQKLLSLGITKRNVNHHRPGHPYRREALAGRRAVLSRQSGVQEKADTGEHVAVPTLPARGCTQPDIIDKFELLLEQPRSQALNTIDGPQEFAGLGAVSNSNTALAACENIHTPSPPSPPFESGSPLNNPLYKLVSAIEFIDGQRMEYIEHANGQNEDATVWKTAEWEATNKFQVDLEEFVARESMRLDYSKMKIDQERLMLEQDKKEFEIWKLAEENKLKTGREKLERQSMKLEREMTFVKITWERMTEAMRTWKLLIDRMGMEIPFSG